MEKMLEDLQDLYSYFDPSSETVVEKLKKENEAHERDILNKNQ